MNTNPKENTVKIGKSNGLVCLIRDRHQITRDDGSVEKGAASVHVFVGPLCVEWWSGLRHLPTVRWDRTGNWKEA